MILYGKVRYNELLTKKLNENGFHVIKTSDLTSADLENDTQYIIENNGHPTEKAWDLITPKISEEMKEKI